jgi:hypothetical protein
MFDNFGLIPTPLPDHPTKGSKHFFGSPENQTAIREAHDCAVICLVRNPLDWIMSFWKTPHFQTPDRTKDLFTFLSSEFYSIHPGWNQEIMEDRNIWTGERYRDLFEMRSIKSRFLRLTVPLLTPRSIFVRYEDLKRDPVVLLKHLAYFGLRPLAPNFKIDRRRVLHEIAPDQFQFSDKPLVENYPVPEEVKELIEARLDFDTEALIGYPKEEILSRCA